MKKIILLCSMVLLSSWFIFWYTPTNIDNAMLDGVETKVKTLPIDRLSHISKKISGVLNLFEDNSRGQYIFSTLQKIIKNIIQEKKVEDSLANLLDPIDQSRIAYHEIFKKNGAQESYGVDIFASWIESDTAFQCMKSNENMWIFGSEKRSKTFTRKDLAKAVDAFIQHEEKQRIPTWICSSKQWTWSDQELYERMCSLKLMDLYDWYFFPEEKVNTHELIDVFSRIIWSDVHPIVGYRNTATEELSSPATIHDASLVMYRLRTGNFCKDKNTDSWDTAEILAELFNT